MDYPNQSLTAKGTVTRKYEENGRFLVDCDILLENSSGEITTPGTATVELPCRNKIVELSLIHI